MTPSFVAILMGSDSDLPIMEKSVQVLQSLEIPFEINILSAHRTPEATMTYVHDADIRGCQVFIAGAGLAAHLAGTIAAHTIKPVIAVPLASGSLQGIDALLASVQMPGGIPVACTAIGSAGAKNAGFLAAQIMALSDSTLRGRLQAQRETQAQSVLDKNQAIKIKWQQ